MKFPEVVHKMGYAYGNHQPNGWTIIELAEQAGVGAAGRSCRLSRQLGNADQRSNNGMTPNEMAKNNANGCQLPASECSLQPMREREREKAGQLLDELMMMTFNECAGFCCSVDQKGVCCVWKRLRPGYAIRFQRQPRGEVWETCHILFYCFTILQKAGATITTMIKWLTRSSCGLNGFMTHFISMAKLFIWQQQWKYSQTQSNNANKARSAQNGKNSASFLKLSFISI